MIKIEDHGAQPFVINIEEATRTNENYRTTLWTGQHFQVTLVTIQPGHDIGLEVHVVDTWAQLQSSKLQVASLNVS